MIKFRYKRKEPSQKQPLLLPALDTLSTMKSASNMDRYAMLKRANSSNSILLSNRHETREYDCDNTNSLASCINAVVVR